MLPRPDAFWVRVAFNQTQRRLQLTTTTSPRRPRLPNDFILSHKRESILQVVAETIAERGYQQTQIKTIVSSARIGRQTFYSIFSGKEDAALALVADAGLAIDADDPTLTVLVIEHVALWRAAQVERARSEVRQAIQVIDSLVEEEVVLLPSSDDPLQHHLPPGRHGLPQSFVSENQKSRLVSGFALAVAECGYPVTLQDVCSRACLSRRTFYEYYSDIEDLGAAMISGGSGPLGAVYTAEVADMPCSALAALVFEIVARRRVNDDTSRAESARAVLRSLLERMEDKV